MNKIKPAGLLAMLCVGFNGKLSAQNNDWENPKLLDWNKEKAHASFMLYDNAADVQKDDYSKSQWHKSLNGTWKFVYVDKYANRINFSTEDLDPGLSKK